MSAAPRLTVGLAVLLLSGLHILSGQTAPPTGPFDGLRFRSVGPASMAGRIEVFLRAVVDGFVAWIWVDTPNRTGRKRAFTVSVSRYTTHKKQAVSI